MSGGPVHSWQSKLQSHESAAVKGTCKTPTEHCVLTRMRLVWQLLLSH